MTSLHASDSFPNNISKRNRLKSYKSVNSYSFDDVIFIICIFIFYLSTHYNSPIDLQYVDTKTPKKRRKPSTSKTILVEHSQLQSLVQ